MRLVIGYDGGEASEAALQDLQLAGLEAAGEARVVCVAPDVGPAVDPAFEKRSPALAWLARDRLQAVMSEAQATARVGADRLAALMPGWTVEPVAATGTPHRVLTDAAEQWPADLLVVGSHGRGVVGRLFHGSVAQMSVNNCQRNVRIARGRKGRADGRPQLLLADDGSPAAEAALNVLAGRKWPAGTQVTVVFVVDVPVVSTPGMGPEAAAYSAEMVEARRELIEYGTELASASASTLGKAGLVASALVLEGHPRYAINEYADKHKIDCIFLGAQGHRAIERWVLGSVASGVAAGAPCSVEVIRP